MRRGVTAYLLFMGVGLAYLGALALVGETRFNAAGLAFTLAAALWLGRGSRGAWWLFVIGNAAALVFALPLIAGALASGGAPLWGNTITLPIGSALMLAILLSRPMRDWVRSPGPA